MSWGYYWGKAKQWVVNNLVAFDRQLNALTGGDPEMTLSGRMGRAVSRGQCWLCKPICKLLDYWQPNHCARQANLELFEGSDQVTGI